MRFLVRFIYLRNFLNICSIFGFFFLPSTKKNVNKPDRENVWKCFYKCVYIYWGTGKKVFASQSTMTFKYNICIFHVQTKILYFRNKYLNALNRFWLCHTQARKGAFKNESLPPRRSLKSMIVRLKWSLLGSTAVRIQIIEVESYG